MPMKHNFESTYPKIPKCNTFQDSMRHSCIFVEGSNDMIIYNEVINSGWYFFPSVNKIKDKGVKENIIEIIKNKNKTNNFKKNFIGIVDKDYDDILKIDSLYYTDYNDLESSALRVLEIEEIYNCLVPTMKNINFEDFKKFYNKALEISLKLSNLWRHVYNIKRNNLLKIKYLINYFDKSEFWFFKKILDNNYNINYKILLDLYCEHESYLKKYTFDEFKLIMEQESFDFRGHDLFFVLGFILINQKIIDAEDYIFFEEKFMKRTKDLLWIKRTQLYSDVKNAKAFK